MERGGNVARNGEEGWGSHADDGNLRLAAGVVVGSAHSGLSGASRHSIGPCRLLHFDGIVVSSWPPATGETANSASGVCSLLPFDVGLVGSAS